MVEINPGKGDKPMKMITDVAARENSALDRYAGSKREPKINGDSPEGTNGVSVMLDLLQNIGRKVSSVPDLDQLVNHIIKMTQQALNASASSVLLLNDKGQELIFEVAEGEAGKKLRRVKLDSQSGIAGWVAHHGQPLLVNDVTTHPYFNRDIDEATGFVTRSLICVPMVVGGKVTGVIEVLNKADSTDFTHQDLETLTSVASTAAMSIDNITLHQAVVDAYKSTIKALAAAIDAKDHYTHGHSQRVMEYALLGGANLALSYDDLEDLEYAGILHDIGKIGIADSILTKPGVLTDDEWQLMRTHSLIGANILDSVPFLEKSRRLVRHHHERYDGRGYPDGLKGEAIPVGARLLAIADAFDTMTTDRSYRAALSVDYATAELHKCSGTQFCPVAVSAFLHGLGKA